MPRTRKNVWKLGQQPWSDVLLWYARGVALLQTRLITSRKSWTFLAAMHGFDQTLWTDFGYLGAEEPLPSPAERGQFWEQCQHQSWYFLPWHRGYLAAFEAAVRDAIAELHGPDDWALPYWDYSDSADPNALHLPPAFVEPRLPDGSPNPLALPLRRRYGDGAGQVVLRSTDVTLGALREPRFTGSTAGGSTGLGGVRTPFRHAGPRSANGVLERQPHNVLHGLIGGRDPAGDPQDPRSYGLMSMPDTAGLDPIFWLHHANIDRLWEVWRRRSAQNQNPADDAWRTGPTDRHFAVPLADGSTWVFTAADVEETQSPRLDYVYESTVDPFGGADFITLRLERLGAPAAVAATARSRLELAMTQPRSELLGANDETVRLTGDAAETRVRLARDATRRTFRSLRTAPMERIEGASSTETPDASAAPDRVFLNLEDVRGVNDAAVFYVYVDQPDAGIPETLVGAVSLFGVRKATASDETHGGNGITESLEITEVVDRLRAAGVNDLDQLRVRLVPRTPIRPEDEISVGRISVFREGR